MRTIMMILAAVGVMALSSCAKPRSKFLAYDGPEVTRIVVFKARARCICCMAAWR